MVADTVARYDDDTMHGGSAIQQRKKAGAGEMGGESERLASISHV